MTTTSPNPEPPARRHRATEQAARRRAARLDARRARRAHREARRAQHHVNQARKALQVREDHGPLTRWEPTPGDRLPDAERGERRRATVLAALFLLWASFNVAALLYMVNSDHTHPHPRHHAATTASAAVQPVAFHTTIPAAAQPAAAQPAAPSGRVVSAVRSGDDRPRCERISDDRARHDGRGAIVVRTGPLDISIGGDHHGADDDEGDGSSCDRTRVHRSADRDKDKDKDKDKDRDRARHSEDRCVCVIPGYRDDDRDGWGERDRTGWGRPWDRDADRDTRAWPSYPAGYDRSDYPRDGRPGDETCRTYPPRVHPDVPDGGTVCSSPDRPSRRW